jgi:peptide/nickel transport system permease protein
MGRYVIRRVMWLGVVVLIISLITFLIYFVFPPSDPTQTFTHGMRTAGASARLSHYFGLDQPVYVQYGKFVGHFFLGDEYGWPGLGFSFYTRAAERPLILSRLVVTGQLILGAAFLWLVLGVLVGVISAVRPRSWADRASMGFALVAVSTPVFFLGLIALYVFWSKLGLSPGTGYVSMGSGFADWAGHMVLPWVVLAMLFAAFYARMTRGSLIEALGEDYVRTARAKGLSEGRVIVRHGLRASLVPVVTMLGMDLGQLFGGAVVTETVFNLPGLGALAIQSARRADLYTVVDITMIVAIAVAVLNLLVDLAYAFLDPRVRYA